MFSLGQRIRRKLEHCGYSQQPMHYYEWEHRKLRFHGHNSHREQQCHDDPGAGFGSRVRIEPDLQVLAHNVKLLGVVDLHAACRDESERLCYKPSRWLAE